MAISNSGYKFPSRKVIVNLAPAPLRKEGLAFDLPIALAVLAASGIVPVPYEKVLARLLVQRAEARTTGRFRQEQALREKIRSALPMRRL